MCDFNAQFDVDHGYPTTTVAYNTRSSQTYKRQSNGVHPTNEGRMQWSDAAYRHFTRMLNGLASQDANGKEDCSLGHNYTVIVTSPTCTEGGYTTRSCACGDSYVSDRVDALGHAFVDGSCTTCGTAAPNTRIAGDINGDGKVNNKDVTRLFQYLTGYDVEIQ